MQHTTVGSTSSTTIYAFGLEEYSYDGSCTLLSSTHYYSLAGHLLGELQLSGSSSTTTFFLTDGLGSVLGVFSDTASSAALLSTQLFTPYSTQLVSNGNSIGQYTAKGFTGQYSDAVSGLDYYVSRYYDPVADVFLAADALDGNLLGMNPYGYVGNNPETFIDPTGGMYANPGGGGTATPTPPPAPSPSNTGSGGGGWLGLGCVVHTVVNVVKTAADVTLGVSSMVNDVQTIFGNASWTDKLLAGADLLLNVAMDVSMVIGVGEDLRIAYEGAKIGLSLLMHGGLETALHAGEDMLGHEAEHLVEKEGEETVAEKAAEAGCPMSFRPSTPVETTHGEQAIGTLKVDEKVLSYNPRTKQMEYKPILHVWIHKDSDLVNLIIMEKVVAQHGKASPTGYTTTRKVIHTTKKHPFFTKEHGFAPVASITIGMHILQADGQYDVVTGWRLVPGVAVMYNLTVAQDHTYTVGDGLFCLALLRTCYWRLPVGEWERRHCIGLNLYACVGGNPEADI